MQTKPEYPFVPQPVATQGEAAVIPNDPTGTNRASFAEGFPEITSKPIAQGGLPPNRLDFNGLYQMTSGIGYAIQTGSTPTFSQSVSDAIGGYPKGAVLWYFLPNGLIKILSSLTENNTKNFINDPSFIDGVNWQELTSQFIEADSVSEAQTLSAADPFNFYYVSD
ncbi:MAG: hypothetical protein LBF28_03060 [Rickettsiales bacterium]|jgi:hypothetical protein|nr:hypothetical protein [Rickettsiales bacterium]